MLSSKSAKSLSGKRSSSTFGARSRRQSDRKTLAVSAKAALERRVGVFNRFIVTFFLTDNQSHLYRDYFTIRCCFALDFGRS
jgi:hypothetical protein